MASVPGRSVRATVQARHEYDRPSARRCQSSDREECQMDALSDVLRAVRLTGAVFFDISALGAVGRRNAAGQSIVGTDLPGRRSSDPVSRRDDAVPAGARSTVNAPVHLTAGDIIVFPHGDAHTMCKRARHAGRAESGALSPAGQRAAAVHAVHGRVARPNRRTSCADTWAATRRPFNPLLAALPRVIHRHRSRRRSDRRASCSLRSPRQGSRDPAARRCSAT